MNKPCSIITLAIALSRFANAGETYTIPGRTPVPEPTSTPIASPSVQPSSVTSGAASGPSVAAAPIASPSNVKVKPAPAPSVTHSTSPLNRPIHVPPPESVPIADKKGSRAAVSHTLRSEAKITHAHLPQILQEVEAKYTQAATLQAEFTQINEVAALKSKKLSSGVIMVKRPNKLRWETLRPDMNLLVSDGRRFWFYTPPFDEGEHGQVIERKTNEINSKLANALLSGHFSVAHDMKIRQESAAKFLLTPKPGTAGTVSRAEIEIDPIRKVIEKVTLEHKGGNRSEIKLTKIELGKTIGDEAFEFTPPPNTDKVEQ